MIKLIIDTDPGVGAPVPASGWPLAWCPPAAARGLGSPQLSLTGELFAIPMSQRPAHSSLGHRPAATAAAASC